MNSMTNNMGATIDPAAAVEHSQDTQKATNAPFKERETDLLRELAQLYTKLNQVREKRAKAEQESSRTHNEHSNALFEDEPGKPRRRRRVLLVTRTLPFRLVYEDAQAQWRAEFPENVSLDGALETYLCLHQNYDCVWIGSVHGDIEPSEQNLVKEQLLQERNYYPVFVDPKREKLFYEGFCRTVMWPLFHSCPPTTDDHLLTHDVENEDICGGDEEGTMEKMWQAYVAVNQSFADAVQEVYEEGDLVWIQGYHLTLVPKMVRNLLPNNNVHVGFFMHIPFPSSELCRIMNNREEVLTGMLGANLIGFQTYEYARHFQSSAVRLLGLESSHKGVDINGHFARITICPVGIDADKYISLVRSDAVQEQIKQLKIQFGNKKVILGVDQLDLTKGLVHKLLAIEELFTQNPELSKEVVFLQIVTDGPAFFETESRLGRQVESLVSKINSKLQDIGAEGPVQYLNKDISVEALVALYSLAHTLVVTPIRDGMNTIPYEYVVCREAAGKHARIVLSEFAGCAQSLGGAKQVNPWNTEEMVDAFLGTLEDSEEVLRTHQHMYSYVSTFTSRQWADNFIEQLRECSEENEMAVSGRELSRRDMTSAYIRSSRRLIFINYEGVLAASASIPELAYPPQELIWQLSMLTKDLRNTVVIVSSRSMSVCEQWFSGLSGNIVLAAEYGVYIKWMGEKEYWHCMVPNMDLSWWEHVLPLLEYYTERTPGAFIERKDSSVAWHYRDCDLDFGLWQASELLVSLREITRALPVSVTPGNRYIEVRPQKVSKASLFERIWEFMGHSTLFPDEEPVTTSFFGEPVKPLSSPLIKPLGMREAEKRRKESLELSSFRLGGDEDEANERSYGNNDETDPAREDGDHAVDFVLVIASGDDRTDEDLFAYLVPPPIDLEAYCRQLELDERDSDKNAVFPITEDDLQDHLKITTTRGSILGRPPSVEKGMLGSSSPGNMSPKSGSFRRLLGRDSFTLSDGGTSGTNHPELVAPSLPRFPSQGESEFLLLSDNITKMYSGSVSKPSISEDAANMFPRTLLNMPTTARRDEITEKSKFTPRRDFPPSAALFKAMKTKYGDNFSIHKLPDTPAACWALVCPPNARAKLEEESDNNNNNAQLGVDRKPSFGGSSTAATCGSPRSTCPTVDDTSTVASESVASSSPPASLHEGSDEVRKEIEALRSLDSEEDNATKMPTLSVSRQTSQHGAESNADSSHYRFPVNTFVCTLGRKLSQAPYYIKNSADLFQLLQEMGLSSHIRKQRMMSMGSQIDV